MMGRKDEPMLARMMFALMRRDLCPCQIARRLLGRSRMTYRVARWEESVAFDWSDWEGR